jgi:hypothetical protein
VTQQMEAEILFLNPDHLNPCVAALVERDFEVEVLDWIDDYGPTIWIKAKATSELTAGHFLDWVSSIVGPLHGDVVEAGLCDPAERGEARQ